MKNADAKMIRCAIYSRVSSDLQDVDNSVARQLSACRAWTAAHDGQLADKHIYVDEAVSGATMLGRPGLQRLLQDLRRPGKPPWDVVLVDDDSRLDRGGNLADLCRQFAARGVRLIAVDSGRDLTADDERLLVHVKAGLNEHYLAELARRTRAGMAQRAIQGWHAGGRIFGYRLVPEWPSEIPSEERTGENRLGTRVEIDEEQAGVVLQIFQRYAEGAGLREITLWLNERGIPASRGGAWDSSAVRVILRNPKYTGDWTWNTHRWRKKPESLMSEEERQRVRETGRHPRQRVAVPEAKHVKVTREDLRIVPQQLWETVSTRFEARKRQGRGKTATRSPLAGLIYCRCGGAVTRMGGNGRGYKALGCSWATNRGPTVCENSRKVSERQILASVLGYLEGEILQPKRIYEAALLVSEKLLAAARRAQEPGAVRRAEKRVRDLQRETRCLAEAIAQGADLSSVIDVLRAKEAELEFARADLAGLTAPKAVAEYRPATMEEIRARIDGLLKDLGAGDERSRKALRKVITRITVEPSNGSWAEGWSLTVQSRPWAIGSESRLAGSGGGI